MPTRMRTLLVVAAFVAAGLAPAAVAAERHAPCLGEEEARQAMLARKLIAPVRAVEAALRNAPGESIGIRLCREDAAMVYDVMILRHDGRLIHVHVDAASGSLAPLPAGR